MIEYSRTTMSGSLEREIKLRFASVDEARGALVAIGASPLHPRRLQSDLILDFDDARLRDARSALRIRLEPDQAFVTFKGAPQASTMKLREELETVVGDGATALTIFERLGFRVWFRAEKYREEFQLNDVVIALDDTPVGTFVEIEGSDEGITATAALLGRGPADYVIESYRTLHAQRRLAEGRPFDDMLFRNTDQ